MSHGSSPGRRRRSRLTSPWRTRPCSSCRGSPGAGGIELGDHRRVVGADEVAEHLRAARWCASRWRRRCPSGRSGCRSAGRRCQRHVGHRPRAPGQGFLGVDGDEGVDFRVQPGDAVEVEPGQFDRRNLLFRQSLAEFLRVLPIIRSPSARGRGRLRSRGRRPGRPRAAVVLADAVVAQALGDVLGVRHRFDALGVDGPHGLGIRGENAIQMAERGFGLGIADLDACQLGDAPNLWEVSDMGK